MKQVQKKALSLLIALMMILSLFGGFVTPVQAAGGICNPPPWLHITNITTNSLRLDWGVSSGAERYYIYRDGVQIASGAGTSSKQSGLKANTTYKYEVRAGNASGLSKSISKTVTTLPDNIEPVNKYKPTGSFEVTASAGTITIKGWVFDQDMPNGTMLVGACIGRQSANEYDTDGSIRINENQLEYGNHNFELTVNTKKTGSQVVNVYVTDIDGGSYTQDQILLGSKTVNFPTAPINALSLTPATDKTFAAATVGYKAQTPHSVTVKNTGNQATGTLTVALSGTNASSFSLNKTSIGSVGVGGSDSFTVTPKTGLAAGTYKAAVKVSGGANITAQSFNVSFNVNGSSTVPAVPSAPASSNITSSSATLSWNSVSGATGYELYRGSTRVYRGTATSYTNTGLAAGTTYSYTVKAYNSAGTSPASAARSVTTPALTLSMSSWNPSSSESKSSNITLTSNTAWTITSNASSWLTASKSSGSGSTTFTLSVKQNTGASKRTGTITVSGGGIKRTINVEQPAITRKLTVNYDFKNGTYTGSGTRTYDKNSSGTAVVALPTTKKSGYTFKGWTIYDSSWKVLATGKTGNYTITTTAGVNSMIYAIAVWK